MNTPTEESAFLWKAPDSELRGAARRKFRARVVRTLGWGGQVFASSTLGWSRENIRKDEQDLATGIDNQDNFHLRGRKRSEHHRPELLNDLKAIVEPRSQTDPTFRSIRNDFGGREKHTPFGVFFPETKEQYFRMATSKVTADFMVDRLEEIIPKLLENARR
ncbi:MAG: hypothetical protein ACJAQT_004018 [Akkermansiaceae bacterium]|jgi:hypothetical protein